MERETLLDWLAAQGHSESATAGMARELLATMERLQAHHIAHRDNHWGLKS